MWTDDRLDDRFDQVDKRFDAIDRRFDTVERRFDHLDARLDALQRTTLQTNAVIIAALVGVIATQL